MPNKSYSRLLANLFSTLSLNYTLRLPSFTCPFVGFACLLAGSSWRPEQEQDAAVCG